MKSIPANTRYDTENEIMVSVPAGSLSGGHFSFGVTFSRMPVQKNVVKKNRKCDIYNILR